MQFLEVSRLPPAEELTLRGITFRSGSAALTPADKLIVDSVVGYVQSRPGYAIRCGPPTTAAATSTRSCRSPRQELADYYLVSKGVDGARLTRRRLRRNQPIATNRDRCGPRAEPA